jgi:hypothetical protein
MRPRRCRPKRLTWEYVTKKGTCLLCQLRAFYKCSKTGRSIRRHREQTLLDRPKEQATSPAARADRKRRQHLIERSFADAANCHGLKRARWRGLWRFLRCPILVLQNSNASYIRRTELLQNDCCRAAASATRYSDISLHKCGRFLEPCSPER